MQQMIVDIPDALSELPVAEQRALMRAGLCEAKQVLARQLQADIVEGEEQVRRFEARYGVALDRFEREYLPTLDTLQAHEDYNDWFYWDQVLAEKRSLLARLQAVQIG